MSVRTITDAALVEESTSSDYVLFQAASHDPRQRGRGVHQVAAEGDHRRAFRRVL